MESVISNEQMNVIVEMVTWGKAKYSQDQFIERITNDLQGFVLEYINHSISFYKYVMNNEEVKLSLIRQLQRML